ncbi:MAG: hypothetical protein KGL10_00095 [Alphaproteobacteria bacterium]|nr:hypothetical protein [Alphaproteobacteria bacterium]MDE2335691.1 hypothetical protein [Alphaproteobacteria bacterium]
MKRPFALLLCTTLLAASVPASAHAQAQTAAPAQQAQTAAPAQQAQTAAPAQQAQAAPKIEYYNYANDESEYSVMLPEAPTVKTIWATSPETKTYLLGNLPEDTTFLGEIGTFERTDMDTEGTFIAQVIFLKAPQSFLASLTEDKIKSILESTYANTQFAGEKFHYSASPGTGALKWATLSGFTMDERHQPAFCVTHYLTGLHSIFVVRVQFNLTDKLYNEYYNKLLSSITYSPP